jgi:hypothetical protein
MGMKIEGYHTSVQRSDGDQAKFDYTTDRCLELAKTDPSRFRLDDKTFGFIFNGDVTVLITKGGGDETFKC